MKPSETHIFISILVATILFFYIYFVNQKVDEAIKIFEAVEACDVN